MRPSKAIPESQGTDLNRALGLIHDYCKRRGWQLLNTIVVSQQSGMPGEGFPEDPSPLEIKVEQGRVFLFDWSAWEEFFVRLGYRDTHFKEALPNTVDIPKSFIRG